jgi:hypothetical protein
MRKEYRKEKQIEKTRLGRFPHSLRPISLPHPIPMVQLVPHTCAVNDAWGPFPQLISPQPSAQDTLPGGPHWSDVHRARLIPPSLTSAWARSSASTFHARGLERFSVCGPSSSGLSSPPQQTQRFLSGPFPRDLP